MGSRRPRAHAAAEVVSFLAIALVMFALARRALVEPPRAAPPPVDLSAAASARQALDAIQEDVARGEGPVVLSDPGPDGRARTLASRIGGGQVLYALGPSRALLRNGGAVPGVYVAEMAFRLTGQVLEIELVGTDREGRSRERRLVALTLKGK